MDFTANGRNGRNKSELRLPAPGGGACDRAGCGVFGEKPDPDLSIVLTPIKPYWHIERARIEGTRNVPVELVVNGHPVARRKSRPTARCGTFPLT